MPCQSEKIMTTAPTALNSAIGVVPSSNFKSKKNLKRFKLITEAIVKRTIQDKNAMNVDLSVVVNDLANRKSMKPRALEEFSDIDLDELKGVSRHNTRMDIVSGLYPDDYNLNDEIQIQRDIGTHKVY